MSFPLKQKIQYFFHFHPLHPLKPADGCRHRWYAEKKNLFAFLFPEKNLFQRCLLIWHWDFYILKRGWRPSPNARTVEMRITKQAYANIMRAFTSTCSHNYKIGINKKIKMIINFMSRAHRSYTVIVSWFLFHGIYGLHQDRIIRHPGAWIGQIIFP